MVHPTLQAAGELEREGVRVEVVNARCIKPLDEGLLGSVLENFDKVITVEENALSGGFGSAVLEFAETHDFHRARIKRLGIEDSFIEHGSRDQLLADLGLDKEGIIRTAKGMQTPGVTSKTAKARKASS